MYHAYTLLLVVSAVFTVAFLWLTTASAHGFALRTHARESAARQRTGRQRPDVTRNSDGAPAIVGPTPWSLVSPAWRSRSVSAACWLSLHSARAPPTPRPVHRTPLWSVSVDPPSRSRVAAR